MELSQKGIQSLLLLLKAVYISIGVKYVESATCEGLQVSLFVTEENLVVRRQFTPVLGTELEAEDQFFLR